MTGAFVFFFVKTKTGMAIRALSQDIYSSKIVGINVETLYILNQWHALCGLVHAAKIGLYPSIFDLHTGKLPAIWGTAERSTHLTC